MNKYSLDPVNKFIFTINKDGNFHSYNNNPAIIYLDTYQCIYMTNGIIFNIEKKHIHTTRDIILETHKQPNNSKEVISYPLPYKPTSSINSSESITSDDIEDDIEEDDSILSKQTLNITINDPPIKVCFGTLDEYIYRECKLLKETNLHSRCSDICKDIINIDRVCDETPKYYSIPKKIMEDDLHNYYKLLISTKQEPINSEPEPIYDIINDNSDESD